MSSDVAENNTVIAHGVNGFLCRSPEEFRQRLIQVAQMPEKEYMSMSHNARKSASNFNIEAYYRQFVALYEKAVAR